MKFSRCPIFGVIQVFGLIFRFSYFSSPFLLNMEWTCELLSPTECGKNDAVPKKGLVAFFFFALLSPKPLCKASNTAGKAT